MAEVVPITKETIDQLIFILEKRPKGVITPWEKDLINNRLDRFKKYGRCNVTPKQVKKIKDIYDKVKLSCLKRL